MGQLGSSLLQTLGGALGMGGDPQSPITPPTAVPTQEINPGMKMFGMTAGDILRGGISETGAISRPEDYSTPGINPNAPNPNEDIVVEGFKPKKMNFWKYLGDNMLRHWGSKPIFQERVDRENMSNALKGFTRDPMGAIQKIAQFDPDKALALYNTIDDNTRQKMESQMRIKAAQDRAWSRIGAMAGAATPDNYPSVVQQLRRYAEAYDIDPEQIPEAYDENWINTIRYGAVPVDNQIDNSRDAQYKGARLNQYQQGINNTQQYRSERLEQMDEGLRLREEANNIRRQNAANKPRKGSTLKYTDPNGSEVEFNKDKTRAVVTRNGKEFFYKIENGKFIRVEE